MTRPGVRHGLALAGIVVIGLIGYRLLTTPLVSSNAVM